MQRSGMIKIGTAEKNSKEVEYGLRIDCKFTDYFRKKIGISHLEYY
jgi:hypothetical protein